MISYAKKLYDVMDSVIVDATPEVIDETIRKASRLLFIGNGGSAAIASHMAIDHCKNGHREALCFNDPAALTCLSNDFGYDQVFSRQIAYHARLGDVLIAISSSGRSENILKAVRHARAIGLKIITVSGFDADNPLRQLGDINYYLPSHEYGFVEIGSLAILHSMI